MIPKFTHDCTNCKFLGHWLNHDAYYCPSNSFGGSLVARNGDNGPDYASKHVGTGCPLGSDYRVGIGNGVSANTNEYLFEGNASPSCRVFVLSQMALAQIYTRSLDWEDLPWWDYTNIKFQKNDTIHHVWLYMSDEQKWNVNYWLEGYEDHSDWVSMDSEKLRKILISPDAKIIHYGRQQNAS